jgi:DNA-binding transcriptional LysR family regulator
LRSKGSLVLEAMAIRYFREVTQSGSIKRAAAALQIAPSAISRQIQRLEHELAVKLFERGARGMNLTNAGHLLLRYAVDSRRQLDDIRMLVQEFDSLQRGHVTLATVEGPLASFISDFVIDLSRQYPGVTVAVTAVGSRDVAEMVGRHEADLGLVFGRAPRRDLIEIARMRQSLCVIVSPRHPLAQKKFCVPKDFAGLRFIVPDPTFGIRQEIDRACARARIDLDIYCVTNSLAFARTVVARSELATFLPQDAAAPELAAKTLVAVPIRDKSLEATQVTLVRPATRTASPPVRRIAQLLAAKMKIQG